MEGLVIKQSSSVESLLKSDEQHSKEHGIIQVDKAEVMLEEFLLSNGDVKRQILMHLSMQYNVPLRLGTYDSRKSEIAMAATKLTDECRSKLLSYLSMKLHQEEQNRLKTEE